MQNEKQIKLLNWLFFRISKTLTLLKVFFGVDQKPVDFQLKEVERAEDAASMLRSNKLFNEH